MNSGNVFVVGRVFAIVPRPYCFILRSIKIRNKTVLQGFTLKGSVKKGDTVRLNLGGEIHNFIALDVIPKETNTFSKDTIYNQLKINIHNHTISEKDKGWIIIDTEEYKNITNGIFVATCR